MKQRITQFQFEELSGPAQLHYVAWAFTKCQETGDHTTAYRSIGHLIQFLDEVTCPDCDTAYCLHWGSDGFETWVEEWEIYAMRHSRRDEMRSKGKQSFE